MHKDIFGISQDALKKRISIELNHFGEFAKLFNDLKKQIQETEAADGWEKIALSGYLNSFSGDTLKTMQKHISYCLRRHPNILSRYSEKSKNNKKFATTFYKWTSAEEKKSLGFNANAFRIPDHMKQIIIERLRGENFNIVDVMIVVEKIYNETKNSEEKLPRLKISTKRLTYLIGQPIENFRAALNILLKHRLIVIAYTASEGLRKGRLTQNIYLTFSDEMYRAAMNDKNVVALKLYSDKNALPQNSFEFTVWNKFLEIIGDKEIIAEDNKNKSEEESQKISDGAQKNSYPTNISSQINDSLEEIKKCMLSFVKISENMTSNEVKRNENLNGLIQMNLQKQKELEQRQDEIAQLTQNLTAMKSILNKNDRDKNALLKGTQNALNMMMGQIVSEIDRFSKIPAHQMDEGKIQTHKSNIIHITIQAEQDIRQILLSFEGN